MNFIERVEEIQRSSQSLLCVGLDTDKAKIPSHLQKSPTAILDFNKVIIEATKDLACAYKINFAFYEGLGAKGWEMIEQTRAMVPSSLLTIADAKRGDIGNTSGYYANAILSSMGFDSITVAPYMGRDSVEPFLQWDEKGVFLLALTSNDGAHDFQKKQIGSRHLFEEVVTTSRTWKHQNNLGYVVGATRSSDIGIVRTLAPNAPLLIPGVGAQGGSLEETVRFGCDAKGTGALINASRSILYASSGRDFAEAARQEAERLVKEIQMIRSSITQ